MVSKRDPFSLLIGVICILGGGAQDPVQLEGADHVALTTPLGRIVIKLRTDAAPQSSAMFARLVRSGLYNGCVFYRAEDFCIQGGLRTGAGQVRANPFGHFPYEYGLPNKRGTVTLARWEDVNSATGEFFINLKDSPHLDRTGTTGWRLGFAVFGEVESGMDIAEQIAKLPTRNQGGMSMLAAPVSFQAEATQLQAASSPSHSSFAAARPRLSIHIDKLGVVPVVLNSQNAPNMVAAIRSLAQRGISGSLHRAEGIPLPPSQGPPYALIQASLSDPDGTLAKMPHEGSLAIERGSVCVIPGSAEFFISLGAHPGWEASMTIIGRVEPLTLEQVVLPILQRPHHNFKHPQFGTVMSMLDAPLPIRLSLSESVDAARPPSKIPEAYLNSPPKMQEAYLNSADAAAAEIEREATRMLRGSFFEFKDL